jgi:hypothetical protein
VEFRETIAHASVFQLRHKGIHWVPNQWRRVMVETLYKWRVVISVLAVVMTGLAIERTIDSGRLHGVGEGALALALWIALVWTLTVHSRSAGVNQSTNF